MFNNHCSRCDQSFTWYKYLTEHDYNCTFTRDNREAAVASTEADAVKHPNHYTRGGIETIDYMKAKLTKEQFTGYLLGNVIKYTSRFQDKNGLEDLKKAEVYLKRLIQQYTPE